MKKERQPLTKREKVLLGLGIVGVGVAGYFAYGYFRNVKLVNKLSGELGEVAKENYAMRAVNDALEETKKELLKTKEDLSFMKFLVVESGCTNMALQNGENKLSRIRTKMAAEIERLASNPNDTQTMQSLMNHQDFEKVLIDKIEQTRMLDQLASNDENIYAK